MEKLYDSRAKDLSKSKSHHLVDDAAAALKRKGIIREEIKGKTGIFAVDYENEGVV